MEYSFLSLISLVDLFLAIRLSGGSVAELPNFDSVYRFGVTLGGL